MFLREYELVYIAKPELDDDTYGQVGTKLGEVVEEAGGYKLLVDLWGRKRLAYEIEDYNKGMYFILNFLGEPSVVAEAERFLRYNDVVLRYMTVKLHDRVDVESRRAEAAREEAERAAKREAEEEAQRRAAEEREKAEAAAAAAAPPKAEPSGEPEPKAKEPKAEEPKAKEPKAEEPKAEEPKAEEPKAEEPKAEEPKAEEPKAEPSGEPEPEADEPKAEEPKEEPAE